jgi:hypothetical protein
MTWTQMATAAAVVSAPSVASLARAPPGVEMTPA